MDLFTKYQKEYEHIIETEGKDKAIVVFYLWVGCRWEEDNNINPWEYEGYIKALKKLKDNKEYALIETIKEYLKNMGKVDRVADLVQAYIDYLSE